jgi:hypothetical protein
MTATLTRKAIPRVETTTARPIIKPFKSWETCPDWQPFDLRPGDDGWRCADFVLSNGEYEQPLSKNDYDYWFDRENPDPKGNRLGPKSNLSESESKVSISTLWAKRAFKVKRDALRDHAGAA